MTYDLLVGPPRPAGRPLDIPGNVEKVDKMSPTFINFSIIINFPTFPEMWELMINVEMLIKYGTC